MPKYENRQLLKLLSHEDIGKSLQIMAVDLGIIFLDYGPRSISQYHLIFKLCTCWE